MRVPRSTFRLRCDVYFKTFTLPPVHFLDGRGTTVPTPQNSSTPCVYHCVPPPHDSCHRPMSVQVRTPPYVWSTRPDFPRFTLTLHYPSLHLAGHSKPTTLLFVSRYYPKKFILLRYRLRPKVFLRIPSMVILMKPLLSEP